MDYRSAISYLDSLQSTDIKLGLERIVAACELLARPEQRFPSVVVAGTNGKGSTCAFLESILRHNGLKVGLYTSPHLIDVRERIQINREMISKDDFATLAELLWNSCETPVKLLRNSLTYFEFLTAMAFLYFAEKRIDIAVLEVGLGGRFDATNVVTPLVSVVTRIGIDHQKYLGATIREIAFEKCGIIKPGVPVVTVDQDAAAMEVIREVADRNGSMVHVTSPHEVRWPLGLAGAHQAENAACALHAAEAVMSTMSLQERPPWNSSGTPVELLWNSCEPPLKLPWNSSGTPVKLPYISHALASTRWPGRLEVVGTSPLVILDGAHNPNGAEALAKFLSSSPPLIKGGKGGFSKIILLLGIMADKDIEGIIKPLIEVADEFILTRPSTPRAADPNVIKDIILRSSPSPGGRELERGGRHNIKIIEPLSKAIRQTMQTMPKDAALIITGSLYTVGEARQILYP